MKKALQTLFLFFCLLGLVKIPFVQTSNGVNGNISFQPNSIPEVEVYYEDYTFVFEYKAFFIRVAPFVIYNNQTFELKQCVQWLKSQYPNIDFKWLVDKATQAIHYGFNMTKLPQTVADKIDYLGFRLVDLNFPLSWFELERIEVLEAEEPYNITRIHVPKANLVLSFEDLYPQGFSVSHINKTYVLIGNVKGKQDLIVDPITFSSPTITVIGGTEGSELDFKDIWDADQTGGWGVVHNNNESDTQYLIDARIVLGNGTEAGTTWFADVNVDVTFPYSATSSTSQKLIDAKAYAHFRLGQLDNAVTKETSEGCKISADMSISHHYGVMIYGTTSGSMELYSSTFQGLDIASPLYDSPTIQLPSNSKVYNSIFDGVQSKTETGSDIFNCDFSNSYHAFSYPSRGIFDDVTTWNNEYAFYCISYYNVEVQNSIIGSVGTSTFRYSSVTTDSHLVNVEAEEWTFTHAGTSTAEVYRQYTFDIYTVFENQTAISNCNVSLTDVDGVELFNLQTDAGGRIASQTVTYGFYNQTGGDTIYLNSPHSLKVFKEGVRMYESVFDITRAMNLTLTLTPRGWQLGTEGIKFTPSCIDEISFTYSNYNFHLSYKQWFLRLKPFAIYNGEVWNIREIVEYLQSHDVSYSWAINKVKQTIHYGFNITGIPESIAANLDYVGFKIADYNFPLSEITLQNITRRENGSIIQFSNLWIEKANFGLSFEDLIDRGYTIQIVNKTYLLIGNVNQTNLDLDPTVYSSPFITVTGFTSDDPGSFQDICDVNDANGWGVMDALGTNEFTLEARLIFGDGENLTYFEDVDKVVTFLEGCTSTSGQNLIAIDNNVTFTLGQLDNAPLKTSSHGCVLISGGFHTSTFFIRNTHTDSNVTISLLSSTFITLSPNKAHSHWISFENPEQTALVYSCNFDNSLLGYIVNTDVYDMRTTRAGYGLYAPVTDSTIERCMISDIEFGVYTIYAQTINLSDTEITDVDWYTFRGNAISAPSYFIDVTYEAGGLGTSWITGSSYFYILYTLELLVTFPNGTAIEGANVTITNYGQSAGQLGTWLTFANGTIPPQTLLYLALQPTYSQLNYNPYNLNIEYGGYSYSGNWTHNERKDWTIALSPPSASGFTFLVMLILIPFISIIVAAIVYLGRKH